MDKFVKKTVAATSALIKAALNRAILLAVLIALFEFDVLSKEALDIIIPHFLII